MKCAASELCSSSDLLPSSSLNLLFQGAPAYGYWGLNYMNLHFHGMSLSFTEEDVHEALDGGEEKTYTFELPMDQETGLYWYHNHAGGTAAYSYMASLMGFIEVLPAADDTPYITTAPGVEGATEVLMMMSEGLVNPDGSVPPLFPIVMEFNWTSVCNGHLPSATIYNFEQGEKALFRVAHAGVEPYIYLSIPGHKMIIVGLDGLPIPSPMEVEEIQLHGGQRVEFLVQFDTLGTFVMTRAPWAALPITPEFCQEAFGIPFAPCISYSVEREVATINVVESTTAATRQALTVDSIELPEYSDNYKALAAQPSVGTKLVRLQQDTDAYPLFQLPFDASVENPPGVPVAFGINDRLWNPYHSAGQVTAGTCETWDVIAFPPGTGHPFHTHTADFLVLKRDGVDVEEPYWRDTEAVNENITIHVCFNKVQPGEMFLVHCHMPSHSDIGMMAHYEVVAADEPTEPSPEGPTEPVPSPPTPSEPTPTQGSPTAPEEPTPSEPTPAAPETSSGVVVVGVTVATWIGWIGAAFFY